MKPETFQPPPAAPKRSDGGRHQGAKPEINGHRQRRFCGEKVGRVASLEERFARVIAVLESRAAFLESNYFENMVVSAVERATLKAASPFVDRAGAAARWHKSESEIDKARRAGLLTDIGGTTPLFEKAQGDALVRAGKWVIASRTPKT